MADTDVRKVSDVELEVTRVFDAPPRIVFAAWTRPDLFRQWWMPKSVGIPIHSCEMDVRTGGGYRLGFLMDDGQVMEFFGKYLEVVPDQRLVWTNDEGAGAVTTVTFEARGEQTLLTYRDRFPTAADLDEALAGSAAGLPEQFAQLDDLLAAPA